MINRLAKLYSSIKDKAPGSLEADKANNAYYDEMDMYIRHVQSISDISYSSARAQALVITHQQKG